MRVTSVAAHVSYVESSVSVHTGRILQRSLRAREKRGGAKTRSHNAPIQLAKAAREFGDIQAAREKGQGDTGLARGRGLQSPDGVHGKDHYRKVTDNVEYATDLVVEKLVEAEAGPGDGIPEV